MPLTLYHGTLQDFIPDIMRDGLEPNEGWGGYGQCGVFLTNNVEEALYWAKFAYVRSRDPNDPDTPTSVERFDSYQTPTDSLVVLEVTIPDEATPTLQADMEQAEDFGFPGEQGDWEDALKMHGSLCMPFKVPPEWIEVHQG